MCYLGRIVSEEGYRISPENTKAMEELRTHEPRGLLGLLGYYRRYVGNFSRIARPIYDLLKTSAVSTKLDMSHLKQTKRKQTNFRFHPKRELCGKKHKQALNVLNDCLTSPPVMAYPDFSQPFILRTDASEEGFGSVIYQKLDRKMRVIGYASRTLNPAE